MEVSMEALRCEECITGGLECAIELEHLDCVLSFFGESEGGNPDVLATNAQLVLDSGLEDIISAVGKKVDFLTILPAALALSTR